ncbi:MAG: ParA family protein [Cetobacterium sp.]|uniref:ParA family protein n=1 Tax=Cetobacterium sp. TaxID=2071632 RepID=UPI003F3ECCE7
MGKIITVKNNKGGVGKSWLTLQLSHVLSILEKDNGLNNKVLILTSDSQNNILLYSGYTGEVESGLEAMVTKNECTEIRIRENLYYVPLLSNNFSRQFREKLKNKVEELKKEYDFIFIDSVPTLNIDQDFLNLADEIIIPTFYDLGTSEGILKLLQEIDTTKVNAIIPNRFNDTKLEKICGENLKESLKGTKILVTEPIKQSAVIAELIYKGKTIWESNSQKVSEVQDILLEVARRLILEK